MKRKHVIGTLICFVILTLIFAVAGLFIEEPFWEGIKLGLFVDVTLAGILIIIRIIYWMIDE